MNAYPLHDPDVGPRRPGDGGGQGGRSRSGADVEPRDPAPYELLHEGRRPGDVGGLGALQGHGRGGEEGRHHPQLLGGLHPLPLRGRAGDDPGARVDRYAGGGGIVLLPAFLGGAPPPGEDRAPKGDADVGVVCAEISEGTGVITSIEAGSSLVALDKAHGPGGGKAAYRWSGVEPTEEGSDDVCFGEVGRISYH